MGKTTQRLENRIKQRPPSNLLDRSSNTKSKSAIGEHLMNSVTCLEEFDKSMFSVVCKARTESVLHVLEALFIKSLKPELCKQMEFVKCLHMV